MKGLEVLVVQLYALEEYEYEWVEKEAEVLTIVEIWRQRPFKSISGSGGAEERSWTHLIC